MRKQTCVLYKSKIKFTDELWYYVILFKQKIIPREIHTLVRKQQICKVTYLKVINDS